MKPWQQHEVCQRRRSGDPSVISWWYLREFNSWVNCLHLFSCTVVPDSSVWFPEAGIPAFINLSLLSVFLLSYCRSFMWRLVAEPCFLYWHAVIPTPKCYSKSKWVKDQPRRTCSNIMELGMVSSPSCTGTSTFEKWDLDSCTNSSVFFTGQHWSEDFLSL